jgi:hypothetical protein
VVGATDVSTPQAGYFRHRLHGGAVRGGVRIFYGPPADPVTGEVLDRSWRWQAEFDGEPIDFDRVWPDCTGDPISAEEYRTYVARRRWAEQHAPDSSYAERSRRRDPLSTSEPLPF